MESAKRKRARNACQRCRTRKGKCTADFKFPCSSCLAVGTPCFVVKRKQRPSQAERRGLPLQDAAGTAKSIESTTIGKKTPENRNSMPEHEEILIPEDASSPAHKTRASYANWDSMSEKQQSYASFSPQKSAAEETHDTRVDSIIHYSSGSAAFAADLRLASWLMVCPLPLQDNIKEALTSVMSGSEAKSETLPSLVLKSLDAMCMRVKELYPGLADECHHCTHHDRCPCYPKGDICTAHTRCQNASRAKERREEKLLSRCERVLALSLGVYDTVNKGSTQEIVPVSSPFHGDLSVASPQTVSSSTPFDGYQLFLDSFQSTYTHPGQLVGQTTIHKDFCSGKGPLDSLLADIDWSAQ